MFYVNCDNGLLMFTVLLQDSSSSCWGPMIKLLIILAPRHMVGGTTLELCWYVHCQFGGNWGWAGGGVDWGWRVAVFVGRRPSTQVWRPQLLPWAGSSNPWSFWVERKSSCTVFLLGWVWTACHDLCAGKEGVERASGLLKWISFSLSAEGTDARWWQKIVSQWQC